MDCKATVNIGDYARGGKTRGENQASDHDMGCKEKYIPCGIVDEDTGWGVLEQHWNGAKLLNVETMLAWAQSMTWKGLHPIVRLNQKVYQKGISLTQSAMQAIESRLERNPLLPKWDILIQPA